MSSLQTPELASKSSFSALGAQLLSLKSEFQLNVRLLKNLLCDSEPSDFLIPGGHFIQQIWADLGLEF